MLKKENLFRISAIIYEDPLNIKSESITKIISFIFLQNNNKPLPISKVVNQLEDNLELIFSNEEITDLLNNNDIFVKTNTNKHPYFSLNTNYFIEIKEISNKNNLYIYLKEYYDKNISDIYHEISYENFKKLIHESLYDAYNGERSELESLFNLKKWNIKSTSFTEQQIRVINGFFEWDNKNKDEEIYKIVSVSLEFFLLTTNIQVEEIKKIFVNKKFYLDTNLLIRLLGVDGGGHNLQTEAFLKAMNQKGVELIITSNVKQEYDSLISAMIRKLKVFLQDGRIVPPKVFEGQIEDSFLGFYRIYYQWLKDKGINDINIFESSLELYLDETLNKYSVSFINIEDFELSKGNYLKYCESLSLYKGKDYDLENINKAIFSDIISIYNIESKRKGNSISIFKEEHFFISFDNFLISWAKSNTTYRVPLVTRPSTWINLSLKFDSRATKNDFSSFVSYLTKSIPISDKLNVERSKIILNEIIKYTDLITDQRKLLMKTVDKIGVSYINNVPKETLNIKRDEVVKEEFAKLMNEKMSKIEQTNKAEMTHKEKEIKQLNADISENKSEISTLHNKVDELSANFEKVNYEKEEYLKFYKSFFKVIHITAITFASMLIALSLFLIINQIVADKQSIFPFNSFIKYLVSGNNYLIYALYLLPTNAIAGVLFKYVIPFLYRKITDKM